MCARGREYVCACMIVSLYVCLCVCVCMRACMRLCVRARKRVSTALKSKCAFPERGNLLI